MLSLFALPGKADDRAFQVSVLEKIAKPVLTSRVPNDRDTAPHEALCRTLTGIAPWLELGPGEDEEGRARARFIDLSVKAIVAATDPKSDRRLDFTLRPQCLVEAAFLSQALIRAPTQLWGNLTGPQRANLVQALKSSRIHKPFENNWLLFSAMVETALLEFTGEGEKEPIETAVNKHMEWYLGDGTYGDGPRWHWDYYNSFVIQPMLWHITEIAAQRKLACGKLYPQVKKRAVRYAAVLERLISPEGAFPIVGRSSTYRFAAFHDLSMAALRHKVDNPAAVRCALTAVIKRMVEAPGTFDEQGWLTIGVAGNQPDMGEGYINRGSVYLCTEGLLQLGLPADDPFWTAPAAPWTQRRIWSGEDQPRDHALRD